MKRTTVTAIFVCAALAWGLAALGSRRHAAAGADNAAPRSLVTTSTSPNHSLTGAFAVVRGREGFWRIVRTRDGIWWFLSPQNKTEYLNGVTTVAPFLRGRDPRGAFFVSRDWDGSDNDASLFRWAERTVVRVRSVGFKSLGAWCNPVLYRCDMPMTRDLNVWQWVPAGARLFSREWQDSAEAAIRDQTLSMRTNRNLIGYYTDNELDWEEPAIGPRVYFDQLPTDDPNRQEVLGVIHETWPTVADFDRDWGTSFRDWPELERHPRLPVGSKTGYDRLADRWLYHFARAYFRITATLVHKYDPNHLILGCRYRGWVPNQVLRGARGYTDAQSLNYYAADGLLDLDVFTSIAQESDQPLIVSEYSFHALDGRSGDRNLVRFPAQVRDQLARAEGYRSMTARLARVPFVIGADWFQWMDEPASGRWSDGEDANMGIVDVNDRPYEALVEAVQQTAPLLNDLHAGSRTDRLESVWRRPAPVSHTGPALAGGAAELMAR